jgi:ABC-type branched-subunit amino acid transport system ATPase component
MLKTIVLKFSENSDLTVDSTGVTIFVGPNNAGKSLLLREIQEAFLRAEYPPLGKILKGYEVTWPTETDVRAEIAKSLPLKPHHLAIGQVFLGRVVPKEVSRASNLMRTS